MNAHRGLLFTLTVVLSISFSGCSKSNEASSNTRPAAAPSAFAGGTSATSATTSQSGDLERGKLVFSANCASCHGASGTEGGVGPSLENERARKNTREAVAWIEDPLPPMPKLYPSPLSSNDVLDVATYVESL